jgi:di/tricarboxylate transporter
MYQEFAEAVLTKQKNKSVFWTRFLISGSAGLALIAPMLIMTLRPSKHMALVTTSVFVVAVAVLLAWVMEDAQNKDIVAATAAYAAVLVVFVGTGSGGG